MSNKKNRSVNTTETGYTFEETPTTMARSTENPEDKNDGVTLPEVGGTEGDSGLEEGESGVTNPPDLEKPEETVPEEPETESPDPKPPVIEDTEESDPEVGEEAYIRLSKDTLEMCEGNLIDVQYETNLDYIDVVSSDEEIAGAERMTNCIRIFGMKKGRAIITVKGLDKAFETVYDEVVVHVKEEVQLETKIEVADKLITKVGSSRVVKLPGYKNISVESLTSDKVSVRIENDDIVIKGLEETDSGKVKITATKAPFVSGYKVINIIVLGKEAIDPELDPNMNRGVVMSVNGYTQSDTFVEKCAELYTNEANYKLSTQIRADLTNRMTGQSIRNSRIILKSLVKDTIRRTYSRVKFTNDSLAKSYIALVCSLDYSSYGENISNIQKKGIIDTVLLAHSTIRKEIEQALNIK